MLEELMQGYAGSIPDGYVKELGNRIKSVMKRKWFVGFHDRGMGHGDFAVLARFKGRDIVVVKCPCREIADYICKLHEDQR
jgi:hypothetical protein